MPLLCNEFLFEGIECLYCSTEPFHFMGSVLHHYTALRETALRVVAGAAGLLGLISDPGGGRSTSKMRNLLHNRVSVTARHVNDMALCIVVPTRADSKGNTTLELSSNIGRTLI